MITDEAGKVMAASVAAAPPLEAISSVEVILSYALASRVKVVEGKVIVTYLSIVIVVSVTMEGPKELSVAFSYLMKGMARAIDAIAKVEATLKIMVISQKEWTRLVFARVDSATKLWNYFNGIFRAL